MKIGLFGIDSNVDENYFLQLKETFNDSFSGIYSHKHNELLPISQKFGIKTYNSSDEIFADVDIVYFAKSLKLNIEFAIKAIKNSCHLFIEDVSNVEIDDLKQLFKVAFEAGINIHIKQTKNFTQEYIELSDYIETPKFVELNIDYNKLIRKQDYYNILLENLIYIEEIVSSKIKKISSTAIPIDIAHFSFIHINIHFDNGSDALLKINNLASDFAETHMIYQKNGNLEIDFNKHFAVKQDFSEGQITRDEFNIQTKPPLGNELDYFINQCKCTDKEFISESPSLLKTIHHTKTLHNQIEQFLLNL